jgi:hypothetical protein
MFLFQGLVKSFLGRQVTEQGRGLVGMKPLLLKAAEKWLRGLIMPTISKQMLTRCVGFVWKKLAKIC